MYSVTAEVVVCVVPEATPPVVAVVSRAVVLDVIVTAAVVVVVTAAAVVVVVVVVVSGTGAHGFFVVPRISDSPAKNAHHDGFASHCVSVQRHMPVEPRMSCMNGRATSSDKPSAKKLVK